MKNDADSKKEPLIKRIAEAPAIALEKTIDESKKIGRSLEREKVVQQAEEFWHLLGPGLTTGAADDDPSGIATYSQAGAQYGFQWLWLAPLTFPLMAVVQEMCARIGIVTSRGLAANIRRHFPRWVLYVCTILLFAANSFNIGANLGAMAKVVQLFIPNFSFVVLVIFFTLLCLLLQVFTAYKKYAKYLKYLSLVLLSYVLSAFLVEMDWRAIFNATVIPTFTFDKTSILLVTGVLGTTISPYLFFWQTSQEIEEEILEGKTAIKSRLITTDQDLKKMRADVWSGMFFSNAAMFFIIATCAATLYQHGITNIATAADAAAALRPLAGEYAYLLFAVGILGLGLLAIPVLAGSAAYALSESFNWREGLYQKLKSAHAFYGVIILSMLVGLATNFIGLDPIKTLIYSAIVNGVIAPVVLILILLISGNKKIMGERVNGTATKIIGWIATGLMTLSSLATLYYLFK